MGLSSTAFQAKGTGVIHLTGYFNRDHDDDDMLHDGKGLLKRMIVPYHSAFLLLATCDNIEQSSIEVTSSHGRDLAGRGMTHRKRCAVFCGSSGVLGDSLTSVDFTSLGLS